LLTKDAAAGRLREFRRRLHGAMRRGADALFELCDAALARGAAPSSTVHLSLEAVHRRGWGSLYGALRHEQIDAEAHGDLLARLLLESVHPPVYAVDVSAWPRNDAEASPGEGTITIRPDTPPGSPS